MKAQYLQIQTALGNTNKRLLSHSAGCLSESVKKGKLVLGNTKKKFQSHLVQARVGAGFEKKGIEKGKFVMTSNIQI